MQRLIELLMNFPFLQDAANLLRVLVLYYTFEFRPDMFSFVHIYAGQAFIIFVGFLFFRVRAGKSSVRQEAAS